MSADAVVHVLAQIYSEGQRLVCCCGIEGRAAGMVSSERAFAVVVDAFALKQIMVGVPDITVIQALESPRGRFQHVKHQRSNVCKACAASYYAAVDAGVNPIFREENDMSDDKNKDGSYQANREGTQLYDNWNYSSARVARAKEELEKAEASYRDAEQKLGKWIMPDDATTGEAIAVWFEDRLIVAEIEYNSLWRVGEPHIYKIKSRPRKRVAAPDPRKPSKGAGSHAFAKPSDPDAE